MKADDIQLLLRNKLWNSWNEIDEKTLRGLLADYIPTYKRERNLLLFLFSEGITKDIELIYNSSKTRFDRYIKTLETDYGIEKMNAVWAVMTWCYVFGCDTEQFEMAYDVQIHKQKVSNKIETYINKENDEGFCIVFNRRQIRSIGALQYELSLAPAEALKYIKRGLLADFFRTIRPDVANKAIDAKEEIDQGFDERLVFQKFLIQLEESEGIKAFVWDDIRFESSKDIFARIAAVVFNKETWNSQLAEIIRKNAISQYMELVGEDSRYVRRLEEDFVRNSYFVLHRMALLDKDYKNGAIQEFKDIDIRINSILDNSINRFIDYIAQFDYKIEDGFRLLALCLLYLGIEETPLGKLTVKDYLSQLLKKNGEWQPPRSFQYCWRKSKPVRYRSERPLVVKKFVHSIESPLVFCPIHHCRLALVQVEKATSYTLTSFKKLQLCYCPECKSYVSGNNEEEQDRNITYNNDETEISEEFIYSFKCKECGTKVSMTKMIVKDYEDQNVSLPQRCSACEKRYRQLKRMFPISKTGVFEKR